MALATDTDTPFDEEGAAGFAARLQQAIGEQSVRSFATRARLSEGVVRKYLRNASYPTLDRLISLAQAGGVRVAWLATGEGPQAALGGDQAALLQAFGTYWRRNAPSDSFFAAAHRFAADYNRGVSNIQHVPGINEVRVNELFELAKVARETEMDAGLDGPPEPESDSNSGGRLDPELLQTVLRTVEQILEESGRGASPEKKAEIATAVYDLYTDTGRPVDKDKVSRLIKILE
jgi:transcriptional regulator with XRE-family HTH domain